MHRINSIQMEKPKQVPLELTNHSVCTHPGYLEMAAACDSNAVSTVSCQSWGANSYGQLAQGHKVDLMVPTFISEKRIQFGNIIGGGGHTLLLSANGKCFSCGWNNKGQLGLGGKLEDVTELTALNCIDETIVHLAAGWDFSAAVTLSGSLFLWGSNSFGQLGLPNITNCTNSPTLVELAQGHHVSHVACGLRHTVILTDDGFVYSCGAARKGQLGVKYGSDNPPRMVTSFKPVHLPPDLSGQVKQVVAGAYHSALLTECGRVLVCGDNKHGQLAQNDCPQKDIFSEVNPDFFEGAKVTSLHSGWTHIVAETDTGVLYSWGRGDYGQLGRRLEQTTCDPRPHSLPQSCSHPKHVVCGAEHNLILTRDGQVLSWGWNEHGMCGSGNEDNIYTPSPIQTLKMVSVARLGCGSGHSFALVNS